MDQKLNRYKIIKNTYIYIVSIKAYIKLEDLYYFLVLCWGTSENVQIKGK